MRGLHGVIVVALFALACSREGAPHPSPPESAAPSSGSTVKPPSVGVARMRPDGTLELDLRGPGGAESRRIYPPTHADYKKTLDHLRGMKPRDEKAIPPWPDPWDASKVESATHAHAATKGWKRDEYTIEIMGTDADGNAVVTLSRGGKSGSIRIETKGYTVKRELGLP